MISYNMMLALLAAMFAATFVVIGCFLLILKPWVKPMRRTWQNSQDVMAEHLLVSAADARRQAAEEHDKANKAAIIAERSRQELIRVQAESDQAEKNRRREALRQDNADEQIQEIEDAIKIEEARARLRWVSLQNEQSTPPPWKMKRQYIKFAVILAVLFILITVASIYFSK